MYTSEVDAVEWQTGNQYAGNSNFATTRSSFHRRLPPFLDAPPGWRSEIIHSNSPLPFVNQVQSTAYESFAPTNIYNENIDYARRNNNQTFVTQQAVLDEQQERNIIHQVERQNPPPLLLRRQLPNNSVVYRQNVSVRYLQPPPLPPPGPLIIREVRPPQPPPLPPLRIREPPRRALTPPPVILRERPPPFPPQLPAQVVERQLPPPPQPPRRVIVEHFGRPPPKPANVIIERWLPYKSPGPRRVLVERAPPIAQTAQEPNLLVQYDSPKACIQRQYINNGVVQADPDAYLRQYGYEIDSHPINNLQAELLQEASRAVPPPAIADYGYHRVSSPCPSTQIYEQTRSITPIHRSSSYYDCTVPPSYCNQSSSNYGYETYRSITPVHRSSSYYDCTVPPSYCNQSSSNYGYERSRSYAEYPTYERSYRTMTDVTPSWNARCGGSYSSYPYHRYSSPRETIHVRSENEFRDVMCNLTHGRVPASLGSY